MRSDATLDEREQSAPVQKKAAKKSSGRKIVRRVLDFAMTVLSVILMGGIFLFPHDIVHEALGATLIVLWILHNALNRSYYKTLFKGRYNARRIVMLLVNAGVLVSSVLLAVSGVILSNHVFRFLNIRVGLGFARSAHLIASHWYYIFIALHFSLHVSAIFGSLPFVKKAAEQGSALWLRVLVIGLSLAISAYGVYAFVLRGFVLYLFYLQPFFFFDLERGIPLFVLDYVSVFVLFCTAFYWLCKLFPSKRKSVPES